VWIRDRRPIAAMNLDAIRYGSIQAQALKLFLPRAYVDG
jgi:hypothetical protein